jgi:hypothetical protein
VRYLGIFVPVLLIVAAATPVVLGWRRAGFATLLGLLLGAAAIGTINKVSDVLGYVLPWRDPRWLHHAGRDYTDPSHCERRTTQGLHSVGWVYGYLTPSRHLYASTRVPRGATPTLLWMTGSAKRCLIEYSLSGGP